MDGLHYSRAIVCYLDPEGHAHYSFGDRDWTKTVLWAVGSLIAALAAIIWRLFAVDDSSLQARFTGQPLEPSNQRTSADTTSP
jgi:hypothetical protein